MNMDDLYGTDPTPEDDTIQRGVPHMSVPCSVCKRPVDTLGEHVLTHPWGRSRPKLVMCSDACFVDYWQARERERERVG